MNEDRFSPTLPFEGGRDRARDGDRAREDVAGAEVEAVGHLQETSRQ